MIIFGRLVNVIVIYNVKYKVKNRIKCPNINNLSIGMTSSRDFVNLKIIYSFEGYKRYIYAINMTNFINLMYVFMNNDKYLSTYRILIK